MTTRLRITMIAALASACASARPATDTSAINTVSLQRVIMPDTGQLTGLSNLFFVSPDSLRPIIPPTWRDVTYAELTEPDGYRPIYVARYREQDTSQHYAVDTDGDLDFTREHALNFRRVGARDMADVTVHLRRVAGDTSSHAVSMQVVVAAPYWYGRVSEYRTGAMTVRGQSYRIELRPRSRSAPFFDRSADTRLLVDADHDAVLRERVAFAADSSLRLTDAVRADRPFMVGGHPVSVTAVSVTGTTLRWRETNVVSAPAVGFDAPSLSAIDLHGVPHTLRHYRGKLVLLSFWSVDCPYSEKVRPALNSLARQLADAGFVWLAMAREGDSAQLTQHVDAHPMSATVLRRDSTAWDEFNPNTSTPLFYLIDEHGRIAMVDEGVTSLAPLVKRILAIVAR